MLSKMHDHASVHATSKTVIVRQQVAITSDFGRGHPGVLSTEVDRMLVGNRVGVDLTRSTINSFAPI